MERLQYEDLGHSSQYVIHFKNMDKGDVVKLYVNKRKTFWVPAKRAWCSLVPSDDHSRGESGHLEIGDAVIGFNEFQKNYLANYLVEEINRVPLIATLHTITIEKYHNYFANGVLTHNDSTGLITYVFLNKIFKPSWDFDYTNIDDTDA